jgi:hypothetical protein
MDHHYNRDIPGLERGDVAEYVPLPAELPGATLQTAQAVWWERSGVAPLSPVLALIAVTNFLPAEFSFSIVGLRLTITRLLLLVLAPFLIARLVSKMTSGQYRFMLSDAMVVLAGGWMLLASAMVVGVGEAMNHAGPEVLEFCVGYLATRALLSAPGQAVSLVNLLCIVMAVIGMIGVLDSFTGRLIIHDVAGDLSGYAIPHQQDFRHGILRASSTMDHPILLGSVCMIGLLCAWALPLRGRTFAICGCVIGLIVSVSSAPVLGTIFGFGLLVFNRMFYWMRWRWRLLVLFIGAFFALSFLVLGSPLGVVNRYLVFDPASGYSREYEWQMAGMFIAQSPWLGIGFGWAEIAKTLGAFASIDSVWLGKALVYGIPCSVLIALSLLGSALAPMTGPGVNLTPIDSRLGTLISIILCLIVFLGFTVYFWGSFWILCAMLAGLRAHLGELGKLGNG